VCVIWQHRRKHDEGRHRGPARAGLQGAQVFLIGIGAFVGAFLGLIEALWLSGGPAGWSGLGPALLTIVLSYAVLGAIAAPPFSLAWRHLPVQMRRGPRFEGMVFGLVFASALLLIDINRSLPAAALESKSLIADGLIACCDVAILAVLFLSFRVKNARRAVRRKRMRVPIAAAICTGLLLAVAGANAWVESGKGSPIARAALIRAPRTWEIPPAGAHESAGPPGENGIAAAHPTHPKLVVIGLDGATWSLMQPLIERGRLPNLAALLASGIGGVLRSSEDSFSPIVWTTLFTGKLPAKHGIDTIHATWSVNRTVRALWSILSDHDETLITGNVPGTYPAEPIHGAMFSGFPSKTETGNTLGYVFSTRPRTQWDRLSGVSVMQLDRSIDTLGGSCTFKIREQSSLPRRTAVISAIEALSDAGGSAIEGSLLKTYATFEVRRNPEGLQFELAGCGDCGFELGKGWSPWILIERGHRPLAFRLRLLEATPEATSIYATPLFLLDPAAQAISAEVPENHEQLERLEAPYLIEASGWLYFRDPRLLDTLAENLFGSAQDRIRELDHLWRRGDWDEFVYVFTIIDRLQHSFWSFLDTREFPRIAPPDPYPNPFPEGIHREDYVQIIPRAYEWVDKEIGRIIGGLPASTLIAIVSDHGFRSGRSRIPGSGIHDPDGIYILSGAGIANPRGADGAPKPTGPTLNLVDVLPTILPLIGLPVAADFDGAPAPFVEETLRRRGGRIAKIGSFESQSEWPRRKRLELDRGAVEQLRSLGYVE